MNPFYLRRLCLGASLAWLGGACGDRCLAYDYPPPSARLVLSDAATGELLCAKADYTVSTSRGPAIAHEDTCEWWLPAWTEPDAVADAVELEVSVTGFLAQSVSIPRVSDECGTVQQPPPIELQLDAAPPE